ncbi:MAG: hypothetical protein C4531_06100 [Desulfurivibrio sp.]|nr:MAG: hypothetical protein C4531_06100 [Desulfurivibrio sp.]
MKKNNSILLAIRTLSYQGGKILGSRWLPLIDALRQVLAKSGFEQPESSDELLLFIFPNPFLALISLRDALESAKLEHGWQESHGALPVQTVIHLLEEEDTLPQIQQTAASEWDMLQQETIYVTRSLMRNWKELTAGRELPEHRFEDEGGGFFQMVIIGKATLRKVELFSYRSLPVHGKIRECFYCGMTSHAPANCPSKFISMKVRGMDQVGYLPFEELNAVYKKIFPDYSDCSEKCAAGIKPAQLRQDRELLVFVAYLDLNLIYQLRFLANTAFNLNPKWEGQDSTDNINIDSRNLHLGLDCLRVGQYTQAEELLTRESKRRDGKQFFATVGLAFWALEQGRAKDMGHYLERAKNIASQEKELLYSQLLLSRYYELHNDFWKAKEAVNLAIKVNADVLECQYRKIQHNVRYGFDEGDLRRLRVLMLGQKEMFMTALLDPLLLQVQGLVNDLAIELMQYQRQEAAKNMAMAETESAELSYWFDQQDPFLEENSRALNELRKQHSKQTFYDLLDVLERAKGHAYGCQRIRKTKIEELETRKKELEGRLKHYQNFWQDYEYKNFFNAYQQSLLSVINSLHATRGLIARQQGQEYRAAVNLLDQVEISLSAMQEMQGKMIWVRLLLNGVKIFVKKAILAELSLLAAGLVIFLALPLLLSNTPYVSLHNILSNPLLQKKSLLIATFFLTPLLAMILTLWQMKNEME